MLAARNGTPGLMSREGKQGAKGVDNCISLDSTSGTTPTLHFTIHQDSSRTERLITMWFAVADTVAVSAYLACILPSVSGGGFQMQVVIEIGGRVSCKDRRNQS